MSAVLELLLADARTPSGGHAHSGGLEAALAEGLSVHEVPAFIRARLRTVGFVEAAFAALAARAKTVDGLLTLDLELAARTPAEPLRRAARVLGAGLLRTACAWWPEAQPLAGYRADSVLTPRPVALGAVARAAALSPLAAARLSLYDDAATVASAAVKLAALDAATASGWLVSLAGEIDQLASRAGASEPDLASRAGASEPDLASRAGGSEPKLATSPSAGASGPSTCTPLLDRRAVAHAGAERRLFAS
jgi:urease accessory protein